MSIIPTGWRKTRVFASGTGATYTAHLERPAENVSFATVVAIDVSGAELVAIERLNRGCATTLDASGNSSKFLYFANTTGLAFNDAPIFPTEPSERFGITLSNISVSWLAGNGDYAVLDSGRINSVELDLWSYHGS